MEFGAALRLKRCCVKSVGIRFLESVSKFSTVAELSGKLSL